MNKSGFVFLMAVLAAFGAVVAPGVSSAQVDVNIEVRLPLPPLPPLPRFVFAAPPTVVVVPETYVYVVPDAEVDIVFYQGYWYRPHGERWYRSAGYNGPWKLLRAAQVPSTFGILPPGFRSVEPERERIPYQKVKKSWKQWEKERYWDSRRNGRDENGRHEGERHDRPGRAKGKGHDK